MSRPRPSKGCIKCKARKLKCDEGKPACLRCIKIGYEKQCAYADPFELVVRDQTSHAAHRAQLKWRQRAGKSIDADEVELQTGASVPPLAPVSPSTSTSSAASDDPVIEKFFYDWIVERGLQADGATHHMFLDFVPNMYMNAPPNGALAAAVSALAHANYAKRCQSIESEEIACRNCGRALNLIKAAMEKPAEAHTDEILAAITMLGFYEVLMSPHVTEKSSWVAHLGGMVSLFNFKLLQHSHPASTVGQIIIVFSQMLANCMIRGSHPTLPLETRDLISITVTPAYKQWEIFYRASELCGDLNYTFRQCLRSPDESLKQLYQLVLRTRKVDKDFEDWSQSLPAEWSCNVIPFNKSTVPTWLWPLCEAKWTPRYIRRYRSLVIESRWRVYWTSRLILNQSILQSVSFLASQTFNPSPPIGGLVNQTEIEFEVRNLIDAICEQAISTFDLSLFNKPEAKSIDEVCTLRGFHLLWSLPTSYLCLIQAPITNFDTNGRLQWISKTLQFIRDNLGITKAGAFLDCRAKSELSVQLWDYVDS